MKIIIENGTLTLRPSPGETGGLTCKLTTLAAWRELLGCATNTETIAMMLTAQDPGILNTKTSENAWTPAYTQLEQNQLNDLNQTTVASLHRAINPQTRALSIDGRTTTRRLLGLPGTPTNDYEVTAQQARATALALADDTPTADEQTVPLPDTVNATELENLLAKYADTIDEARTAFRESLVTVRPRPIPQQ